ncbi:MAG: hypothetical protein HZA77_02175 [Candidatus Schekmanbacteria bacterium]|nr:hypothetical protein [Candidatus Schekmanbacteria bacterium]
MKIVVRQPQNEDERLQMKKLLYEVCINEKDWPAEKVIEGYKESEIDLIALNGNEIAGVLKIVFDSPKGLPITKSDAFPEVDIHSNEAFPVEIALTVIDKRYRGKTTILLSLFKGMHQTLKARNPSTNMYAILEREIYNLYHFYGFKFEKLNEGKHYWNGWSYPCVLNLEEGMEYLKMNKLRIYEFFVGGSDL